MDNHGITILYHHISVDLLGPVAQLVARPTANHWVPSWIQAPSHTFAEIDDEIISTVIFLLPLIPEGLLSVISESMCRNYWLTD